MLRPLTVNVALSGDMTTTVVFDGPTGDDRGSPDNASVRAGTWLLPDDSIGVVKRKIADALVDVPPEALYLWSRVPMTGSAEHWFGLLRGDSPTIPAGVLRAFRSNAGVRRQSGRGIEGSFTDVIALQLTGRRLRVGIPVGCNVPISAQAYPADPLEFRAEDYVPAPVPAPESLAAHDDALLGDAPFVGSTIFAVTPEAAMSSLDDSQLQRMLFAYYPKLGSGDVVDRADVHAAVDRFRRAAPKVGGEAFSRYVSSVDLMASGIGDVAPITEQGFKRMKFEVGAPPGAAPPPSGRAFERLSTSEERPLVVHVQGAGKSALLKLFTSGRSTAGQGVPVLDRARTLRLAREFPRARGVGWVNASRETPVWCFMRVDGVTTVTVLPGAPTPFPEATEIARECLDDGLGVLRPLMTQHGYGMPSPTLDALAASIVDAEYSVATPSTAPLQVRQHQGCIATAFNIVKATTTHADLTFKRVAGFSALDSQDAYVVQALNNGESRDEISAGLQANFSLTETEALDVLADFASKLGMTQDAFNASQLRIRANPGFPVDISRDRRTGGTVLAVSGLSASLYVDTVPVYCRSLLALSMFADDIQASPYSDAVTKLCTKKKPPADVAPQAQLPGHGCRHRRGRVGRR